MKNKTNELYPNKENTTVVNEGIINGMVYTIVKLENEFIGYIAFNRQGLNLSEIYTRADQLGLKGHNCMCLSIIDETHYIYSCFKSISKSQMFKSLDTLWYTKRHISEDDTIVDIYNSIKILNKAKE